MPRYGHPVFEHLLSDFTPSEAWGTYAGKQWYFYARWNGWAFAMNDAGMSDPGAVLDVQRTAAEDRQQFFPAQLIRDWEQSFVVVDDHYGDGGFAASYMPEADMRRLINACIDRFKAPESEA